MRRLPRIRLRCGAGRYEENTQKSKDVTVIQNVGSKFMFWAGLYRKKQKAAIY